MDWKEQARNRFSTSADAEKWGDIYSSSSPNVEAVAFRMRRDYAVETVLQNIPENAQVLDLGCGAGPVLMKLQQHNYKLIGMDYAPDMLTSARKVLSENAQFIPLVRAECEKTPLPDASMDCVVCLGVISYAVSIGSAIDELYRVLKPGGMAVVSYRNYYNPVLMDPIATLVHIVTFPLRLMRGEKKEIGRSIRRSEVLGHIKNTSFVINAEKHMGFGNLRFARKTLSDGKLAITVNKILDKVLRFPGLGILYRLMADVHIFVLVKPD